MSKKLSIYIAAGGTAGHINPALALGAVLQSRGHRVTFVGQANKLEGKLVPEAGFDFFPIIVSGLDRKRPWTVFKAARQLKTAKKTLLYAFEDSKPDVCVGFGAYVEVPLLSAAKKRKIPYVIHEQNSVSGLANSMCAKDAAVIAYAFPESKIQLQKKAGKNTRFFQTGIPVKSEIGSVSKELARDELNISQEKSVLLVFGGSLGARSLNTAFVDLYPKLKENIPNLFVLHSTGSLDFETVKQATKKFTDYETFPYIEKMSYALAAADVAFSRAGASTIAELIASKTPALLVPYPLATKDHQTKNAAFLSSAGAATVIRDDELTTTRLEELLYGLLQDKANVQKMQQSYASLQKGQASELLAQEVECAALS